MGVCGGGTHPFGRRLALITPLPRYRKLEKVSGYLAHTQITFSTHVHIGMDSGDQAMHVMTHMVPAPTADQYPDWVARAAEHFDGEIIIGDDLTTITV